MMEKPHKESNLREKIRFYLIDCRTIPGKLIDIFIIFLNLLICGIFVAETYPISKETAAILWKIEYITVFFFIIEYILRLYGSENRLKYVVSVYSIIDIIAILPTISLMLLPASAMQLGVIKLLRVLKVLRVFRFLRFTADPHFFFGIISVRILRVMRLFVTILIIFFISAGLFWFMEKSPVNPGVQTFGDAFYFTVVSLTTVGFGDISPVSEGGRWVTVAMILSGIILIPWQAGRIVKEWLRISSKREIVCSSCGLRYHDPDASHCKACGHVIYQLYDGN